MVTVLTLVAAELLIGSAIVNDTTTLETFHYFSFLSISVIHTARNNFAKLPSTS